MLDRLWDRVPRLAERVEEALDWIEADPPDQRAVRRVFTNGVRAVTVTGGGETWVVFWAEAGDNVGHVLAIAEETSI